MTLESRNILRIFTFMGFVYMLLHSYIHVRNTITVKNSDRPTQFTDTKANTQMVQLSLSLLFTPAPDWQESLWTEHSEYAAQRRAVSLLSCFHCTASQHAGQSCV